MIETSTYQYKIYEATKTLKREDGFKLVLQRHRARSARFPQDRVRFLQPRGRSRSEAALRNVGDSEDGEQESVDEESVRLRMYDMRQPFPCNADRTPSRHTHLPIRHPPPHSPSLPCR